MIYQIYQTLGEFNGTGVSGIFAYVANTVPIFIPMLLLSPLPNRVFPIIMLSAKSALAFASLISIPI